MLHRTQQNACTSQQPQPSAAFAVFWCTTSREVLGEAAGFNFFLKEKIFRSISSGKVPQMLSKKNMQDALNLTIYSPAAGGNLHNFITDFERDIILQDIICF